MSAPDEDEFDWRDPDTLAVPPQRALAVYQNPFGDVVIRQEGDGYNIEDTWVIVRPQNARALVAAILREAGLADLDAATGRSPAKDATGAERARRHRERKRNAPVTDETVACHGNVTALAPLDHQPELLEAAE